MLAGSDVVAELFAKLDQIEGPNAERPIVTIACFADNTQRLEIDMVRLGKIRATVSPEAWRLLCDVYFPNAIWGGHQRGRCAAPSVRRLMKHGRSLVALLASRKIFRRYVADAVIVPLHLTALPRLFTIRPPNRGEL